MLPSYLDHDRLNRWQQKISPRTCRARLELCYKLQLKSKYIASYGCNFQSEYLYKYAIYVMLFARVLLYLKMRLIFNYQGVTKNARLENSVL